MPTDPHPYPHPPRHPPTPARLEWWANTLTCLADFAVEVTATADGAGWDAVAQPPFTGAQAEALDLFLAADPWFTLRHPDGTTDPVEVTYTQDVNHLRLSAR